MPLHPLDKDNKEMRVKVADDNRRPSEVSLAIKTDVSIVSCIQCVDVPKNFLNRRIYALTIQ